MMVMTMAALAMTIAPAAEARQASQGIWSGARYGTVAVFPSIFRLQRESDNGDGATFATPDGAMLIVYATANPNPVPIRDYIQGRIANQPGRVTYRHIGIAEAVISGRYGDRIFYQRFRFDGMNDRVHSFRLDYPEHLQARYGPIIRQIDIHPGR